MVPKCINEAQSREMLCVREGFSLGEWRRGAYIVGVKAHRFAGHISAAVRV